MRQFLVLGHDAPTTPDFSLNDLAGGAGRLDVLCRSVTAGLLTSHGVREDAAVSLVLDNTFVLRFSGNGIRGLNPDERSTAARIRGALERRDEAVGRVAVETSPGVEIRRGGFERALSDLAAEAGTVVRLHENGKPAVDIDPPDDVLFVLSDHREFTDDELALLDDHADLRVSLGPVALHADQAATVAHNWLDTEGYRRH